MKLNFDLDSAIMFTEWQTIKELKTKTGIEIPEIKKELKRLIDRGEVHKRGEKYKYDNA